MLPDTNEFQSQTGMPQLLNLHYNACHRWLQSLNFTMNKYELLTSTREPLLSCILEHASHKLWPPNSRSCLNFWDGSLTHVFCHSWSCTLKHRCCSYWSWTLKHIFLNYCAWAMKPKFHIWFPCILERTHWHLIQRTHPSDLTLCKKHLDIPQPMYQVCVLQILSLQYDIHIFQLMSLCSSVHMLQLLIFISVAYMPPLQSWHFMNSSHH